jgi:hypothetical protein
MRVIHSYSLLRQLILRPKQQQDEAGESLPLICESLLPVWLFGPRRNFDGVVTGRSMFFDSVASHLARRQFNSAMLGLRSNGTVNRLKNGAAHQTKKS